MVLHTAARTGYLYSTAGLQLDEELAQAKHAKEQRFLFTTSARVAASSEGYLALLYVEPWWRRRAAQRTPLEVAQRSLCLGVASIDHESSCCQRPSFAELSWEILAQVSQLLCTKLPDSDAQLRTAAELGELDEVQRLLRVEEQGDGNAGLMLGAGHDLHNARVRQAAAEGDTQSVYELLHHDVVALDATDADGTTALHLAAEFHRVAVVDVLLAAGADVNATDDSGATALLAAVLTGQGCRAKAAEQTVQMLISARADINAADDEGLSPLAVVKAQGSTIHVEMLSGRRDLVMSASEQEQPPRDDLFALRAVQSMDQAQTVHPSPTLVQQDSDTSDKQAPSIYSDAGDGGRVDSAVVKPHRWWSWELFERTVRAWTAY
eukprot:COSAG02_NODE_2845_length_7905_cov_15.063413_1_plen_379_part_00